MSFSIKKIIEQIKFKYSPTIPNLDYGNRDSRKNWILFMAKRTKRFPVREIYDIMVPHVSKMTVNNDLKGLEEEKLIRREKANSTQRSYVIPLFEDSGELVLNPQERKRKQLLDFGLPSLCAVLMTILVTIQAMGL